MNWFVGVVCDSNSYYSYSTTTDRALCSFFMMKEKVRRYRSLAYEIQIYHTIQNVIATDEVRSNIDHASFRVNRSICFLIFRQNFHNFLKFSRSC
jgi:hypothetical protein